MYTKFLLNKEKQTLYSNIEALVILCGYSTTLR